MQYLLRHLSSNVVNIYYTIHDVYEIFRVFNVGIRVRDDINYNSIIQRSPVLFSYKHNIQYIFLHFLLHVAH